MLSFCHWANMSGVFKQTENQHRIPQEKLQNALYLSDLSPSAKQELAGLNCFYSLSLHPKYMGTLMSGLALEQSSCSPRLLSCSPEMICASCSNGRCPLRARKFNHVLPSGKRQKCIVAGTCLSRIINRAKQRDASKHTTGIQNLQKKCNKT